MERTELDDIMEQIDAAKDIIHYYTCVSCEVATAQTPVILVADLPEGGSRVTIVGICDACAKDANDAAQNTAN